VDAYDDLAPAEIISVLGSLEVADLAALDRHERSGRTRTEVLAAIKAELERRSESAERLLEGGRRSGGARGRRAR
jgi:hypothetical protein